MNIKELKEMIKDIPDNTEIFVGKRMTEFDYGLINSAKIKEINFMEDFGDKPLCKANVLVLEEE